MNLIQETKNAISYKNHIDMDGDYNPDYIMLINKAFNGDEEKIKWLKERFIGQRFILKYPIQKQSTGNGLQGYTRCL